MTEEQRKRLDELRWAHERSSKRMELDKRIREIDSFDSYSFLTDELSDKIMQSHDNWPQDKWTHKLFLQTPLDILIPVEDILKRFILLDATRTVYIYFMRYNFGLVETLKGNLIRHWKKYIEIDTNEIFCFIPGRPQFICIEKTEDFIVGDEKSGLKWIYEVTFSSDKFKAELNENGT
jgi:hypothetical protein